MDALYHARSSAQKWGGTPEEYLPFHKWFDETSFHVNDKRHRMMRHHSFGIGEMMKLFGEYYTNTAGKTVPLKQIGEQHVVEDIGFIPTVSDWIRGIPREKWMDGRPGRFKKVTTVVTPPKKWFVTMLWQTTDDEYNPIWIQSWAHHQSISSSGEKYALYHRAHDNIDSILECMRITGDDRWLVSQSEEFCLRFDHAHERPEYKNTQIKRVIYDLGEES